MTATATAPERLNGTPALPAEEKARSLDLATELREQLKGLEMDLEDAQETVKGIKAKIEQTTNKLWRVLDEAGHPERTPLFPVSEGTNGTHAETPAEDNTWQTIPLSEALSELKKASRKSSMMPSSGPWANWPNSSASTVRIG